MMLSLWGWGLGVDLIVSDPEIFYLLFMSGNRIDPDQTPFTSDLSLHLLLGLSIPILRENTISRR